MNARNGYEGKTKPEGLTLTETQEIEQTAAKEIAKKYGVEAFYVKQNGWIIIAPFERLKGNKEIDTLANKIIEYLKQYNIKANIVTKAEAYITLRTWEG